MSLNFLAFPPFQNCLFASLAEELFDSSGVNRLYKYFLQTTDEVCQTDRLTELLDKKKEVFKKVEKLKIERQEVISQNFDITKIEKQIKKFIAKYDRLIKQIEKEIERLETLRCRRIEEELMLLVLV